MTLLTRSSELSGWLHGLAAYLIWGLVVPVYFRSLRHVEPAVLLSHRTLFATLVLGAVILYRGEFKVVLKLARARPALFLLTGTLLISNWLIFIWAINQGRLLEVSLGYFINPLLNVALGLLVLRERLNRWQGFAVGLAAMGVLYFALHFGVMPWVPLSLAFTFGLYGLVRKQFGVGSLSGLFIECALMAPPALAYLLFVNRSGAFADASPSTLTLIALSGIVTAIPLLFFGEALRRLPLSGLGLIQYLSPLCQFGLAVVVYDEPFTSTHAVTFGLIVAGLVVFSTQAWRRSPALTLEKV